MHNFVWLMQIIFFSEFCCEAIELDINFNGFKQKGIYRKQQGEVINSHSYWKSDDGHAIWHFTPEHCKYLPFLKKNWNNLHYFLLKPRPKVINKDFAHSVPLRNGTHKQITNGLISFLIAGVKGLSLKKILFKGHLPWESFKYHIAWFIT